MKCPQSQQFAMVQLSRATQSGWFWLFACGWISAVGCGDGDDKSSVSDDVDTPQSGRVAQVITAGDQTSPDVILISIDTLRPDHLGTYGYERDTSPTLDSLASCAATFENAFAQSSWTLPSHISLVTSTYPAVHQVDTELRSLPAAIPTLAESLQANGYETTGFVSWIYLAAKFGFGRGFDRYDELVPPEDLQDSSSKHSIRAAGVVDSVLIWATNYARSRDGHEHHSEIREVSVGDTDDPATEGERAHELGATAAPRAPFFLFVHFFDPHMDYDPPLEDARRFDPTIESTDSGSYEALKPYIAGLDANVPKIPKEVIVRAIDLYDAEIRYTDRELGRLLNGLRRLALLDRAVIVVTSDHGEEFGEHGSMEGHQWTLYDEVLRVPLFIAAPGVEKGVRISEIVESIDIAPTLLQWAGVQAPPSYQGRPLQPLLSNRPDYARAEALRSDGQPSDRELSDERPSEGQISGGQRAEREAVAWEERTFAEIGRFVMRASLRTPEHKLIYTKDTAGKNRLGVPIEPGFQLFDLHTDPFEQHNRYAPENPVSQQLSERLRAWAAHRGAPPSIVEPQLTAEERERLRSVGYIGR